MLVLLLDPPKRRRKEKRTRGERERGGVPLATFRIGPSEEEKCVPVRYLPVCLCVDKELYNRQTDTGNDGKGAYKLVVR